MPRYEGSIPAHEGSAASSDGSLPPHGRATTSHTAQERLVADAEKDAEFPGHRIPFPEGAQGVPTVLVMRSTRDLPGHEREIRRIRGGPPCLVGAKHSASEPRRARAESMRLVEARTPGSMGVGEDPRKSRVRSYVTAPSDHVQRDLDRRFGRGMAGIRAATATAMEAVPSAVRARTRVPRSTAAGAPAPRRHPRRAQQPPQL